MCKTNNFVPLVVPGLSTGSRSNSSSASTSQDLSSTSPAQERSDGQAPREWCGSPSKKPQHNKKRDESRDSSDRLQDLPEWLEEFTDNLEDTELLATAHSSHESGPTEIASKPRKHIIKTHFPEDGNYEVCLRTKMTRAPCRKRKGEALPRAEEFGDLRTADHKVVTRL